MIPWTTDEVIHRIVKRDVPNSERGTIATLNDLPDWMVEEARAIARESLVGAVRYLRFYVATQYVSSAEDFIEDVLLKGQEAATWSIQDCVCIPREPTYTTALEIQYLDPSRWILAMERIANLTAMGSRWSSNSSASCSPNAWAPP